MSRKDYVAIAAILANERKYAVPEAEVVLGAVAYRLADLFNKENSKFDRERFLQACGVPA